MNEKEIKKLIENKKNLPFISQHWVINEINQKKEPAVSIKKYQTKKFLCYPFYKSILNYD